MTPPDETTGACDLRRLYTTEEVAEVLHLSVTGIRKLARQKKIPAYRVGHFWRFDLEEVKAALRRAA